MDGVIQKKRGRKSKGARKAASLRLPVELYAELERAAQTAKPRKTLNDVATTWLMAGRNGAATMS
jgi:hypothetical protein